MFIEYTTIHVHLYEVSKCSLSVLTFLTKPLTLALPILKGDVLTINKFNFDDDGFSVFVFKIEQHEPDSQKCIIGLENPHSRLVDFLIQRGFNVIPTHPLSISKYRESRIPSKAKSDPMDARLIADYIRDIKALEPLVCQMIP